MLARGIGRSIISAMRSIARVHPSGLLVLAVLCGTWLAAGSALAASGAAPLDLATESARIFERSVMGWRLAIAIAALVVVGLPWLVGLRKQGNRAPTALNPRWETLRITLLLFLAFAAFSSYYDFFKPKAGIGFKDTDVYHYYMGSKYFSEVGYFDLYHCTVMALLDAGFESRFDLPPVRDQRTLRLHTPETTLAAARQCKKQFTPARWQSFASDVGWFHDQFHGRRPWRVLLYDHGYNPSPVWNAIGSAITSRVPLEGEGFSWLIRADRILVVLALGLVVWAFGLEVGALATIVWGTGQHWAYSWIGDSLLRNLWLFAAVAGLCFLKQRKHVVAGALLALASLLRIFPAIFIAGFGLAEGRRMARGESGRDRALPFAIGAGVAALGLLVFAALASAWGATAFIEFGDKISVFTDQKSLNKLGLSSLIWRSIMVGTGHLVTNADGNAILTPFAPAWLAFAIRGGQLAVVVPAVYWFWKAARHLQSWEVAALGFALIPLLSDPANYYFSFVVCGALLAGSRPVLGTALLFGSAVWIANGLVFYRVPEEYLGAGFVAIALPLFFLYALSRKAVARD